MFFKQFECSYDDTLINYKPLKDQVNVKVSEILKKRRDEQRDRVLKQLTTSRSKNTIETGNESARSHSSMLRVGSSASRLNRVNLA